MHRLADDAMWAQALAVGAVDCCLSRDLPRILENADRYIAIKEAEATRLHSARRCVHGS